MKKATKEESIKVVKAMLKMRLKNAGKYDGISDKWLTDKATEIVDETPEGISVLESEPKELVK